MDGHYIKAIGLTQYGIKIATPTMNSQDWRSGLGWICTIRPNHLEKEKRVI
jgi:hypothetical protein